MFRRLFTRFTSLAMVALVFLIGAGAALSGDLPSGVQDAVAEAAGAVGFDVPTSSEQGQWGVQDAAPQSDDHVQAVHETIDDHTTALDAWTMCVAEAAASRGGTHSDPDTRVEGEKFDPTAECEPKPKLDVPRPADDGFDGPQNGHTPDEPGKPDNPGSADNTGPPSKRP